MVFCGRLTICQIPDGRRTDRNGLSGDWKVSLRERRETTPEIDIHGPADGPDSFLWRLVGTEGIKCRFRFGGVLRSSNEIK